MWWWLVVGGGWWWMLINCDGILITEEKARLVNEYAVKVTEMPLYYDKNRSLLIKNSTTLTFGTVRDRGMSTLFILNKVSCSPRPLDSADTHSHFFYYLYICCCGLDSGEKSGEDHRRVPVAARLLDQAGPHAQRG
jgi:hypothetical protein